MSDNLFDYWISLPLAPAFTENISLAIKLVGENGGLSPTVNGDISDPDTPLYAPAHGTKSNNGRALLHFRMPLRMNEDELIAFLESVMSNPKPPISAELIRSASKIIETIAPDTGEVTWEYETLLVATKSTFIAFMDAVDGSPPGQADAIYLSGYSGSSAILL